MVIKRVKYCREMNRVRAKGHWVSQLGIHWSYAEVLLLKAKVLTHLGWTITYPIPLLSPHPILQLSSLYSHQVFSFPSLNPHSVPSQDCLTLHFLTKNSSPNQHPILILAHSYALPRLSVPSAATFFSFSGPTPSLVSLVFLQLQGHLPSTPYQSLGPNRFPNFHPSHPYSQIYFSFTNSTPISPKVLPMLPIPEPSPVLTIFLALGLLLSVFEDFASQTFSYFSLPVTLISTPFSHFRWCFSLWTMFLFLTFVPVFFPYLLI